MAIEHHIPVSPKNFKRLLETLQQHNDQQPLPISTQTMEFIRDIGYFIKEH